MPKAGVESLKRSRVFILFSVSAPSHAYAFFFFYRDAITSSTND